MHSAAGFGSATQNAMPVSGSTQCGRAAEHGDGLVESSTRMPSMQVTSVPSSRQRVPVTPSQNGSGAGSVVQNAQSSVSSLRTDGLDHDLGVSHAGYSARMPSPVETAVQTYIRASAERDPLARRKLLESCFAEHGRFVTRSTVIHGRAGVDAMIGRALADPEMLGFRMTSVVDAVGTTFRYRSIVDRRDGTTTEFFDAGEIDADGKIATLLVFAGPLADAAS
jgi:hypothetical protein